MMKLFSFLLVVAFFISSCSFDIRILTPAPVEIVFQSATPATSFPVETSSSVTKTPHPGFTPVTPDPVFFGAFTASDSANGSSQARFPAGTKQVFAIWNYQNMREGLAIKREWYLDGQLWLEREETWNFAKYGERGSVMDVSIYDFNIGLPSGEYKLLMYIDGVAQPIGKTTEGGAAPFIEFEILPPIEARSPNGNWSVRANLDRLILIDSSGAQSDLFIGREIAAVTWFSDNQHLLLVDRDRSTQVAAGLSVGVHDDLWIVDISSREAIMVYASDMPITASNGLLVSPDGRFVASQEGSGFGDACFVDVRMIFFEIAGDFRSARVFKQGQFGGIPVVKEGVIFPAEAGGWVGSGQFAVPLSATCAPDGSLNGSYVFDLEKLTVTKK